MPKKILIIGTLPPPIGGVTIHIKRLLDQLEKSDIPFVFLDIKRTKWQEIWHIVKNARIIHLNVSNPYLQWMFAIYSLLFKKKLVITFHGEIYRRKGVLNFIETITIKLCKIPIVLNKKSVIIASRFNRETRLISAFIPPAFIKELDSKTIDNISTLRKKCKVIFGTNACNISFDKKNREIYQISLLVKLFNHLPDKGLIVSDPSGRYAPWLAEKGLVFNENILFLSFPHDFNAVIHECDCIIRFTTTDGDSLSVKEALWAGKPVIASNVVDRPNQVILVPNDLEELKRIIISFIPYNIIEFTDNAFDDIYKIYKTLLEPFKEKRYARDTQQIL